MDLIPLLYAIRVSETTQIGTLVFLKSIKHESIRKKKMIEVSELLQVKPDTKELIQKEYGLDKPEKVEQAIDILEQWLKKQNHFTKKEYDRKYLEMTIYDTKGSIEKAKEKLEKRCIFRTVLPHFFEVDGLDEFKDLFECQAVIAPLPKLTDQHYRILAFKFYNNRYFDEHSLSNYFKLCFFFYEYLKLKDLCAGYIFVMDLRNISITASLAKMKLMELKHWSTFFVEAQGMRLKKFIYLSNSKTMETFVKITNPFLTKKLANRVHVFRDVEELHKITSKDILPVEYGGMERSIMEIQADWVKVLFSKENMKYFTEMRNAKIDESIKKIDQKDNYNEMAGSFVSLNID